MAPLLSPCLLPNHCHRVRWPLAAGDLGVWMQGPLTSPVHGYRRRYGGSGPVWQGRLKAFPLEQDDYLLTVVRYVERNALRAGLVTQAEEGPWSSVPVWLQPPLSPWLDPGPVPRPSAWRPYVQAPQTEAEGAAVRRCAERGRP